MPTSPPSESNNPVMLFLGVVVWCIMGFMMTIVALVMLPPTLVMGLISMIAGSVFEEMDTF